MKPFVYIASPYTKGDPAINVRFQCQIFDDLIKDDRCWPVAPLWSHFQHTVWPLHYQDWIDYDKALISMMASSDVPIACLRLDSHFAQTGYYCSESSGADNEVSLFKSYEKPVFYNVSELYDWIYGGCK